MYIMRSISELQQTNYVHHSVIIRDPPQQYRHSFPSENLQIYENNLLI